MLDFVSNYARGLLTSLKLNLILLKSSLWESSKSPIMDCSLFAFFDIVSTASF